MDDESGESMDRIEEVPLRCLGESQDEICSFLFGYGCSCVIGK